MPSKTVKAFILQQHKQPTTKRTKIWDSILHHKATNPSSNSHIKDPNTADEIFEEVVKSAQDAAVLVLVY